MHTTNDDLENRPWALSGKTRDRGDHQRPGVIVLPGSRTQLAMPIPTHTQVHHAVTLHFPESSKQAPATQTQGAGSDKAAVQGSPHPFVLATLLEKAGGDRAPLLETNEAAV